MAVMKMGDAAAVLGVSVDAVRRLADAGAFRAKRTAGGHRVVDAKELAAYAAAYAAERPDAGRASARNRFDGIVTAVRRDKAAASVEIQAGRHRLVSLMTREAADELGLEPGTRVVASVKATNLAVETR